MFSCEPEGSRSPENWALAGISCTDGVEEHPVAGELSSLRSGSESRQESLPFVFGKCYAESG